jgi:outer membrane protein assembly factor BamB
MALIEANPKEYVLKGKFKLKTHNGESWSHPVIAGGKLYLVGAHPTKAYLG